MGDVINYYDPTMVAGRKEALREATVLSVKPGNDPILVLSNAAYVPSTTKVKRIKVMSEGVSVDYPSGFYSPINTYNLSHEGTATVADAIAIEGESFTAIHERNLVELKRKAEADGFAPMDMILNAKRSKHK